MKWLSSCLLAGAAILVLAACASLNPAEGGGNNLPTQPVATLPATVEPATPRPGVQPVSSQQPGEQLASTSQPVLPGALPEAAGALLARAKEDLSKRLGVAEDQIELISFDEVVWPDGSLGCPKPGEVYTQALVNGYRIILGYQGQQYDYHADSRNVFLCEGISLGEGQPQRLTPELRLLNMARADLQQRLGVSAEEIVPEPVQPKLWPDASLGCPQAGQSYAQVETKGFEIILKVKGNSYIYHTDLERVVYCGTR